MAVLLPHRPYITPSDALRSTHLRNTPLHLPTGSTAPHPPSPIADLLLLSLGLCPLLSLLGLVSILSSLFGPSHALAFDAIPVSPNPTLMRTTVPHMALLRTGILEDAVLAYGTVVGRWHI
ncbi:hypothetical protein EPUS_08786 [Endocarpon pusillum Z07020]|uniref:Uncharacterized protein n=1 Tax=Endocarpon pusillum (strain Z07020 / HMAS-L-300199) TaxID=1263415 RepID=U1FZJ2_ENDPU|nr:uncharacterized protein EPUS_08786 [Endocarpon pusillum Z07020]ERF70362.1 hypothetical protein EPUS_08786 [Endocarpon pusillum Z07020]